MIYALNNTSSNINFTSNLRCVYNRSTNALKYMNTTKLFRQDLDWDGFAELLISKYKDVDKVNIYSYACSDGSEPYSLVIKLLEKSEKLKINCDKFFPIRAKDIDKKMISLASDGLLPVHKTEENILKKYPHYFIKTNLKLPENYGSDAVWKVKPLLRNKVIFQQNDITRDIYSVKPDNTVVMARNFWIYLDGDAQRNVLAKDLHTLLRKNSMLVTGNSENIIQCDVVSMLEKLGFSKTHINNIFEAPVKKQNFKWIYY